MQTLRLTALLVCLLILPFSRPAYSMSDCRIDGYPYVIQCEGLQMKDGAYPLMVKLYKVSARVRNPESEPVIWIPDNIAWPSSNRAPSIIQLLSRLRNQRDVMWLEFLRAKSATTSTDCQPVHHASTMQRLLLQESAKHNPSCTRWLKSKDHLSAFTFRQIAYQYEAAAQQLGLKQVTLVTEGRGALIAQAWQAIAPKRIRLQVHDSPPFPSGRDLSAMAENQAETLKQLFERCAQSPSCRSHGMYQMQDFKQLLERLPVNISAQDPFTLQKLRFTLDDKNFAYWLGQLLSAPTRSQYLPAALKSATKEHWQPMLGLIIFNWSRQPEAIDEALYKGSFCANRLAIGNTAPLGFTAAWFYQQMLTHQQHICFDLPELKTSPLTHASTYAVPTLILTNSALSSEASSASLTVVAPGAGKSVFSHACARDVIARFYNTILHDHAPLESAALDAECLTNIPPPLLHHWYLTEGSP